MKIINLQNLKVERRRSGGYVRGRYGQEEVDEYQIRGVVQPVEGEELLQLPEGDRVRDNRYLWTTERLNINDIVTYNDVKYEIQSVNDWSPYCTGHYKIRMVKLDK